MNQPIKLKKNGHPANVRGRAEVFGRSDIPVIQHYEENKGEFKLSTRVNLATNTLIKLLSTAGLNARITQTSEFNGMTDGMDRCNRSDVSLAELTAELKEKHSGVRISFDGRKVRVSTYVSSYDIVDFDEELRRAEVESQLPILEGDEALCTKVTKARNRYLDGLSEIDFHDAAEKLRGPGMTDPMVTLALVDPFLLDIIRTSEAVVLNAVLNGFGELP